MTKIKLDEIIEKHKAQPVGHGYIDIIIARDNYQDFVSELVKNGYVIESISWWEWCPGEKESNYGLGGPKSIFYDGWFSEIPCDIDNLIFDKEAKAETIIQLIINNIETKEISFSDEVVTFKQSLWLTPAIWLEVPDDWRNTFPVS